MLGKNVAFLLTRLPDTVFTVEQPDFYNTLTSIRGSQHENYLTAIDTSLKYIEDKEGIRCVVFLTAGLPTDERVINAFANQQEKFDALYYTTCCQSVEINSFPYDNAIQKSRGVLNANHSYNPIAQGFALREKFKALLEDINEISTTTIVPLPQTTQTTDNLKLHLGQNIDNNQPIIVTINNVEYTLGRQIPSYAMYYDYSTSNYILNLKTIINYLNISLTEWQNATVTVEYTITT